MIISSLHKFIFLKSVKTAGTSFEIALSKYTGPDDIVTPIGQKDENIRSTLGYPGPQNYMNHIPSSEIGGLRKPANFYNHMTAERIKKLVYPQHWTEYTKCSIVRNPFDLAVSQFFWVHRDAETSKFHFEEWLRSRPKRLARNKAITHIDGECIIDFMIRFEHFEEDIGQFVKLVGLPISLYHEFNSIRAKGSSRPREATTRSMFANFDDGKKIIEELFSQEIRRYGYDPY